MAGKNIQRVKFFFIGHSFFYFRVQTSIWWRVKQREKKKGLRIVKWLKYPCFTVWKNLIWAYITSTRLCITPNKCYSNMLWCLCYSTGATVPLVLYNHFEFQIFTHASTQLHDHVHAFVVLWIYPGSYKGIYMSKYMPMYLSNQFQTPSKEFHG